MEAEELDIVIEADGEVAFVYDDRLAALFQGEDLRTTRASRVEPAGDWCPHCGTVERRYPDCLWAHVTAGWTADMRPVGGPVLTAPDGDGFETRAAALAAERDWIRKELGL